MADGVMPVTCIHCGKTYDMPAELGGLMLPCRLCGVRFVLPEAPQAALQGETTRRLDDRLRRREETRWRKEETRVLREKRRRRKQERQRRKKGRQ